MRNIRGRVVLAVAATIELAAVLALQALSRCAVAGFRQDEQLVRPAEG